MRQTSAMLSVTASALLLAGVVFVGTPTTPQSRLVSAVANVAPQSGGSARGFQQRFHVCGTPELRAADVELIERFADAEYRKLGRRAPALFGPIDVAFHCVYRTFLTFDPITFTFVYVPEGLLTEAEVIAQVDAMNVAFASTGISFNLDPANISYTENQEWFFHSPGTAAERNMKLALGYDSSQYLNLYSTGLSSVGLLGYATFPWNRSRSPELDGVVIAYDSVPGGALTAYNEGDTAVHEVGHWCGLYHTFQGGCSRRNDGVSDTPAEADAFFGCQPTEPDTCPAPGLDPIFNFMDYSDDPCLIEFTPGQATRMTKFLTIFRAGLQ